MASYSSILRKDKPLNALSRGLKKDGGLQNGVLIEKIYCDRNKGRKSSNIRLVDSSSAGNAKNESELITNRRNSDLSEKPESNNENIETKIPKMLQTLETTHTFVTNSAGSYYLQTKKETQSIIDDLEEFPALGTNKPTKRVTDATQMSGLSPYAKPFVFTGAFEDNTIYNAYRYYHNNDGSDEYDAGIYDVEFYSGNPNVNNDEIWDGTEWNGAEQVETSSPNAEYEIADNTDDPDYGSIALSRKRYLSKLSVDAKPFELKKNVTKRNTSERHASEDSAVPSLRPSYRSISVESSPFVPRNSSQLNIRSVENSFKPNEENDILTDDKIKRNSFKSQFDEQSRNFRIDREAVIQSCEDTKYASPGYKSPSARINPSKDIPTDSNDYKKSERRGVNLSLEAKPFNINKTCQNNSFDGKEKDMQDDSYSKKKFPLMPLPSNVSKVTAPPNTNLRPNAHAFSLTKSKLEKQFDDFENHDFYSSTYDRNNSPTKSTSPIVNGSPSNRTFKASQSSKYNDYKQVQHDSKTSQYTNVRPDAQYFSTTKSKYEKQIDDLENHNPNSPTYNRNNSPPKNTDSSVSGSQSNRTFKASQSFAYNAYKQAQNGNDNIVSWRRGALSNSSDDTSNRETIEAKKFNQVSPIHRPSFMPTERHNKGNYKLSREAQSLKPPKENETVENKDYNDPKTESNYNDRSYMPYVQPWSNGYESPISSSNLNNSPRNISNSSSANEDEDSRMGNSRFEKPVLLDPNDSQNKIGVQYKDHFKRETGSNIAPIVGNTNIEHPENSNQLSKNYSPNCSPEPKGARPFHTLSHDLSEPYTKIQSPERQQHGFMQQWNNYNQYRYDQTNAIYQPQWPPASFPTPLNIRSVEQANSRLNMSPIHHQTLNNHVDNFARHPAENAPANMNANFYPQAPGYDAQLWNLRQPYNGTHSDPMMAYRQPVNCTAPNSIINPSFPIPNRYIGPQIMPHNAMPMPYNLANRFPNEYKNENLPPIPQFMPHNPMPAPHNMLKNFANEYRNENQKPIPQMVNHNSMLIQHNIPNRFRNEYRNENQSPVKNTRIIETNLIVNNGANRTPPPWPTNCTRDFHHFTDMYAQKLSSQMLPIIQANHLVSAITQNSQIDVNPSRSEPITPDYLQDEQTTKRFPFHSQGFADHVEVTEETSKSAEVNFTKITEPVEKPVKNVMSVLQKENPSLLIPPPIPPRRNINANRTSRDGLSIADKSANSLIGNNPFKNNSSLRNHAYEETISIRNEKTADLFPETNINQNHSENNFWPSEDPSTKIVLQNNNNVSKNPFLNDFTLASSGEITHKLESIDLNPFRQQLSASPSAKPRGKNPFLDIEIENVDSRKVTLKNHPIIDLPKDPLWYYRDPQNNVQGPFTSIEMAEWFHSGYFKDDVKIRRNCDKRYVGIGEFLKLTGGSSPFLESRSVPPLGLEAIISRKSTNPFSNDWQSNLSLKSCELYDS